MSDSREFKEAFNKVKDVGVGLTDKEIETVLVCVDFSSQPDYSIVDGTVVPRSYVDDFAKTCFDNNPLLQFKERNA